MYWKAIGKAVFLVFVAFILTCYASAASAWGEPDRPPMNWNNYEIALQNEKGQFYNIANADTKRVLKFGHFYENVVKEVESNQRLRKEEDKPENKGKSSVSEWVKVKDGVWVYKFEERDLVSGKTKMMSFLFGRLTNLETGKKTNVVWLRRVHIKGLGDMPKSFIHDMMMKLAKRTVLKD